MSGEIPHLLLSFGSLTAIDEAVKGYLSYLRGGVPPSHNRNLRIKRLQNLHLRLANVPKEPGVSTHFPRSPADNEALQAALKGFVRLVRQMVPPSPKRDEVLQALEDLSQQL